MAPPSRTTGWSVLLITIDTLRADHLGLYGYRRRTSPNIDSLAREGTVFEAAYTFWPKTRGSFVMIHTGRTPSQNGYSRRSPVLQGFNPTIASVLKDAGYVTAAAVDNPNVAAQLGYARGFQSYLETWQDKTLKTKIDCARAITKEGKRFLASATKEQPFFLWLHYVNPHAPYGPPPPYDKMFLDSDAQAGPELPVVASFHGGVVRQLAVPGQTHLGYYVAQYDGEIAAADREVGDVIAALKASAVRDRTLVIVTADHGESLGEHDYYFDHGEDLFDPCLRIPLVVVKPGSAAGARTRVLASTLDLMPTILDAAKVPYPPDLAGTSLLPFTTGREGTRTRLAAENERDLIASFDRRFKTVRTAPQDREHFALYDRETDPGETADVGGSNPQEFRAGRREVELFMERADREWARTLRLLKGAPEGEGKLTVEACDRLRALGYVVAQCGG